MTCLVSVASLGFAPAADAASRVHVPGTGKPVFVEPTTTTTKAPATTTTTKAPPRKVVVYKYVQVPRATTTSTPPKTTTSTAAPAAPVETTTSTSTTTTEAPTTTTTTTSEAPLPVAGEQPTRLAGVADSMTYVVAALFAALLAFATVTLFVMSRMARRAVVGSHGRAAVEPIGVRLRRRLQMPSSEAFARRLIQGEPKSGIPDLTAIFGTTIMRRSQDR